MNYFDRNLELLASRQPELANHLREVSSERVKVFPSAAGLPTAVYHKAASDSSLHSRYDPMREARDLVQKIDVAGADYLILLGFGLGYTLDALLEQGCEPHSRRYFVIESDMGILAAALAARDLSRILSLPHLHFAWPVTGPDLSRQWEKFFDPVRAQGSVFVRHPPSIAIDPAHFKSAVELIQSQTIQIFTDINTLVARSREFLDNFVQNLPRARMSPGISGFAGRFKGIPAVLVAAGPSLDKNVHELRAAENRILILSTDTALKPLLSTGIEPHFVLTGDPSEQNYLHLKDSRTKDALLVAEATTYPASLREFDARTVICTFENSSLRALSELLGSKGTLRAWGSVATMALDFALLLSCDPIIFIGQDLAHSGGRIYCSGLHFDERWFQGIVSPEGWERRLQELRKGKKTLALRDIFDHPVESSDKLAAYWNWITKEISAHPGVRFINATEGGILREQVEIMSLREALYRHCSTDLNLRRKVQDAFRRARRDVRPVPASDLEVIRREAAGLSRILQRGLGICNDRSIADPHYLYRQLEKIKEDVYANARIAPLVDCFNQLGNVNFLRRQAALTSHPLEETSVEGVRTIYREYFEAVQLSLQAIDNALLQISGTVG